MITINVVYDESDIIQESLTSQVADIVEVLKKTTVNKIDSGFRPHLDGSIIGTILVDDNIVINFVHESLWIIDEEYAESTYGKNLIPFKRDYQQMIQSIYSKLN